MRRIAIQTLVLLAWLGAVPWAQAGGQGYPGGGGQMPRPGAGSPTGGSQLGDEIPNTSTEKPDAAAKKAFNAGMKSLNKARELEKAGNLDKASDAYSRALDQFTEALSNKGDMVDAWNNAGYVHLRLGAFSESIDDYNHALTLKPDLLDAVEHRGEDYMAVDRLDDAKAAYMNLFNHARPLADQLMVSMQKWLASHRAAANGMRPADIDSFDKWLQERDGIAKQTASIP